MIVDNVWKLTNTVRVGLDARSSHAQRQSTFPDNVCSYCPPCHGHSVTQKIWLLFCFSGIFFLFFPSSIFLFSQNEEEDWPNEYGRLTCVGGFWTPPWLTWCGLNKHLRSSGKRWTKRTHTHHTHTHTAYSLTDAPIHIHFPLCLTHQYIRSTVKLDTPHTWPYLTNYQPCW